MDLGDYPDSKITMILIVLRFRQ